MVFNATFNNISVISWRSVHMVVGFTTTNSISAYHQWCCEFESPSGRGVQHYVIKFVSDLWQVGCFLRVLRFIKFNYEYTYTQKCCSLLYFNKELQNHYLWKKVFSKFWRKKYYQNFILITVYSIIVALWYELICLIRQ
jgi:hypothetical protein